MIDALRWVVAIGEVAAIGGIVYWFAIRIQQLLNYAEQLLEAARVLLALAPGKSAPRTEAPEPEVVGKAWGFIDMVPADFRPSPVKRVPVDTVPSNELITPEQIARHRHAAPKGK